MNCMNFFDDVSVEIWNFAKDFSLRNGANFDDANDFASENFQKITKIFMNKFNPKLGIARNFVFGICKKLWRQNVCKMTRMNEKFNAFCRSATVETFYIAEFYEESECVKFDEKTTEKIICLTLRCAKFIDDSYIRKIACECGFDENWLFNLVFAARKYRETALCKIPYSFVAKLLGISANCVSKRISKIYEEFSQKEFVS